MSAHAQLLKFVDDELARSAAMIERCVTGTLALLRDTRDALARVSASASSRSSKRCSARVRYQARFLEALREGVQRELAAQDGSAGPAIAAAPAALELMDESRVEADIEISRAMQLIDSTAEWERRELQTFTSTLCGPAARQRRLEPAAAGGLRLGLVGGRLCRRRGARASAPRCCACRSA